MKKTLITIVLTVTIFCTTFAAPTIVTAEQSSYKSTTTEISTTTVVEKETAAKEVIETTTKIKETTKKEPQKFYYKNVELLYNSKYDITSNYLTKRKGIVYYNGHKETWYSQKVLPGNGLNIPGRHVADDGTVRDKDGYICVACDPDFYSKGSKLMTSLGPAKVYDCGCAYGIVDIYVNW